MQHRTHYPIVLLCRVWEVSTAGFYAYHRRPAASAVDADLREAVQRTHRESRGTYGRPRMVRALRAVGHAVSPKRVRRVMRQKDSRACAKADVSRARLTAPMPGP